MRLMVDANIILDVLQAREPYLADSSAISRMCETKMAEGHISTLSFANLVYVMRKELDPEAIEEILKILSLIYRFDDLTQADLSNAASLKWNDFDKKNGDFIHVFNMNDGFSAMVIDDDGTLIETNMDDIQQALVKNGIETPNIWRLQMPKY